MATVSKPEWEDVGGGLKRRILTDGEKLMQVEVLFAPGAEGYAHQHHNEQTTMVVSGGGVYTLGDTKYDLRAGDMIAVPSGMLHGFVAQEGTETILLDTFSPPREDFR